MEKNNKWWILVAMAAALAMIFVDQTALPIALPSIQKEFNSSNIILQWIVNAYLVVLAALIIFGGKIGDLLGHRKIFLYGIVIFISASIACALSPTSIFMIISRAIQGIGGALMIPASGVMVINAFKPEERGKAMGIYFSIASLFLSFGPFLGGFITQILGWRWVFWINMPLACVSIILTLLAKNYPSQGMLKNEKLDWLGFFTLSITIFALIFALMEGVNYGWNSSMIIAAFLISTIFFLLFIAVELEVKDPIVDLNFFKDKIFLTCFSLLIVIQIILISTVFWSIFLQTILGYSALSSGLIMLTALVPITFASPIAGKLFDSHGPYLTVRLGSILLMISAVWIGYFSTYQNYWVIIPGFIIFGIGAPFVISSSVTSIITYSAPQKRGVVTGLANTARQLGGAMGLALLGGIIMNLEQFHLDKILLHARLPHYSLKALDQILIHPMTDIALAQTKFLQESVISAYTYGFSICMYVVAFLAFIGWILAGNLPRAAIKEEQDEASAESI